MNVEQIRVIKVGEEEIAVEDTSPQVQQMVAVYNEWRQTAADRKSDLSMAEMALRSLGMDIQNTIVQENAAKEVQAANETEVVPADEGDVPTDEVVAEAAAAVADSGEGA